MHSQLNMLVPENIKEILLLWQALLRNHTTCQILSLAENPRWSPSVAIMILPFSQHLNQIGGNTIFIRILITLFHWGSDLEKIFYINTGFWITWKLFTISTIKMSSPRAISALAKNKCISSMKDFPNVREKKTWILKLNYTGPKLIKFLGYAELCHAHLKLYVRQ